MYTTVVHAVRKIVLGHTTAVYPTLCMTTGHTTVVYAAQWLCTPLLCTHEHTCIHEHRAHRVHKLNTTKAKHLHNTN